MSDIHSPIRTLTRTSLRLNVFLFVSLLLVIVLLLSCYWSLLRLVEEEGDIVEFHFLRLMGNIHSHEDFLAQLARRTDETTRRLDQAVIPLQYKLLERSPRITLYEGREFSFSLPFNLAIQEESELPSQRDEGILSLGVMLSNVYSSYWTTSRYPATQVFLLDMQRPISLAVPSMDAAPELHGRDRLGYLQTVEKIRQHIRARSGSPREGRVRWAKAGHFFGKGGRHDKDLELIAFTRAEIPDSLWRRNAAPKDVLAVSLLDLPRLNEFAHALKRPIFDALELRSPEGTVLAGQVELEGGVSGKYRLTWHGLFIRVQSEDGWSGLYQIDYDTLLHYAKWHLLLLASLLLLISSGGILALRWYISRVVLPADEAHRYVIESDAFSSLIIETGQVGICVIRRLDGSVVLENRLAREWLEDSQSIVRMSRKWCPADRDQQAPLSPIEEDQIEVNGRYLRIGFALTRYHGEDVILCTFHDVTAHRLTEEKLAEAKRSADAASEAKTVFLATMSHEIRTPLYGVLGTLELLGLTKLSAQQQEYLQTIQHSSSSLLQLISDILDVSKIESGQMPLDLAEFSPFDLIEEVMRTYSAAAGAKGLQFYSCIDPKTPEKMIGDVTRVRQILGNLISNAIKFTDMGRVALRLRCSFEEDSQVHTVWQVSDTGEGIPRDQQARLFEPFYQVLSGQCTLSGTGLGLSICSRLSELMDGRIDVVSDVGLGSSFTLRLSLPTVECTSPDTRELLQAGTVFVRAPVRDLATNLSDWLEQWGAKAVVIRGDEEPTGAPGAVLLDVLPDLLPSLQWPHARVVCVNGPSSPNVEGISVNLFALREIAQAVRQAQKGELPTSRDAASTQGRLWKKLGLRALVAEDNVFNQQLLKEQLEELGCTVCLCPDGREALQVWLSGHFDVLLTDVNMPVMNGYELATEIRARNPQMPIIGVTANAMKEEGERCMAVGMNAWIVKPLSLLMLYERLCKVCEIVPFESMEETFEPRGNLGMSEKTWSLMLKVIGEDIELARAHIAREDCAGTLDRLHRIRGSWAIIQGGDLLAFCQRVERLLAEKGADKEAFRAATVVLDQMEQVIRAL
ncbi:ATP-binding protein [Pseudomonas aeruginosa]|uniref:ATP-binding protein n=1 Tax=Pseudomonas aeruginosa TaxID=287 RepID=UPI000F546100|nr:ATP-binding protein [Pseudomonas aeruginosa]RQC55892.1 hybrid sensor histidine kinase/response regulator [Pseudomonas aeruginosa]RQF50956.1 hybrid sensor histidine kinase/response regulator [Pseudomonas aeruginosa]